jgi:hypothetical protein
METLVIAIIFLSFNYRLKMALNLDGMIPGFTDAMII